MCALCLAVCAQNTFHVVVFADTDDSSIGKGVKVNLTKLEDFITNASAALSTSGVTTKKYIYKSTDCNPTNFKKVISSLQCDGDIVMFYYGGHGGRSIKECSNFPEMCLASNNVSDFYSVEKLQSELKNKNPRLLLILTDCCNSYYDAPMPASRMAAAGPVSSASSYSAQRYKDLLLNQTGVLTFTGSTKGSYSWYNMLMGGFFTKSLMESLDFSLARTDETPDWNVIAQDATDQTKQMAETAYQLRQITMKQVPYYESTVKMASSQTVQQTPKVKETPTVNNTVQVQNNSTDYQKLPMGNGYYYGNVVNGKRHGRGSYVFDNGQRFEGFFKNDEIEGSGIYFWSDTNFFAGTWDGTGHRTGYGIQVNSDGTYLVGYWQNEQYIGQSVTPAQSNRLNYTNGYYIGETKNGVAHGRGKYYWNDGSTFEGTWIDGVINGSGLLTFAGGQGCFVGYWTNGKREQCYGVQCLSNGSRMIGFWENEVYRYKSLLLD